MRSVASLAALVVALAAGIAHGGATCRAAAPRSDCGYVGITQQQCQSKGCCWDPVGGSDDGTPWCFHPSAEVRGYKVTHAAKTGAAVEAESALAATPPLRSCQRGPRP